MGTNIDQLKPAELFRKNWQPRFACKFTYLAQDILRKPFKSHLVSAFTNEPCKTKIFISETVLKGEHRERFDHIRKALSSWDISQIAAHTNRIWIKFGGEIFPAFMRWSELGKLGAELEIEVADLTRYVVELKDGKLILTGIKKNIDELDNSQIRERISAYLANSTQEIPPVLYANVTPERKVKLCTDSKGQDFYFKLPFFGQWVKGSIAAIRFLSREKISVTTYKRDMEDSIYSKSYETTFPAGEDKPPELSQKALRRMIVQTSLSLHCVSQMIAAWIWGESKLTITALERKVGSNSSCQLCSVEGLPYFLRGVRAIYPKISKVTVVLREEMVKKQLANTATLYAPNINPEEKPDDWFAVYLLPLRSYKGVLLRKKKPL